ncbi:signal peptidase I [Streptomyces sp. NBC_00249]|uniref:signal peptidase I n=1 Tax=Streptomyces sp. NBC_00249 TaxID=2975690 RepID=UPI0022501484|nr:signal peptidase I [Streptomyces sp. NBC_00249]MCX5198821.1 signal peptidase I [Streptomyces sp. NBC_00249]
MEHRPGRGRGIAAIVLLVLGAVILGGVTVAKAVNPPARYTEGKQVGWTMTPTYTNGESIYLEPVAKGKLRRGDVVLASVPWSLQKTQMNRVVAVGGDRIQYKPSSKVAGQYRLVLNGTPLDEPYLEQWKYPSTVAFDVRVPKGHVFLMADNRLNSDGSQYANNGPVRADKIVSKVVAYPMAKMAVWGQLAGALLILGGGVLLAVARRARRRAPQPAAVAAQAPSAPVAPAAAGAVESAEAQEAAQGSQAPQGAQGGAAEAPAASGERADVQS